MKQTGVAILLVEDDPDMAEMFSLGLSFAGHDVEVTGDGGAALERASQKRFDVVFLDVQLPGIDGLTTLARLRANRSTRDLPLAMLTNSGDETLRRTPDVLLVLPYVGLYHDGLPVNRRAGVRCVGRARPERLRVAPSRSDQAHLRPRPVRPPDARHPHHWEGAFPLAAERHHRRLSL